MIKNCLTSIFNKFKIPQTDRQTDRQTDSTSTIVRKGRDSNFELLRVVAMLMIIIYHIVYHVIQYQLTDPSSITRMGNSLYNNPILYKRLLLLSIINTFGLCANAIFILISGYFTCNKDNRSKIYKIGIKLLSQLGFVTIILMIFSGIIFKFYGNKYFINMLTINYFNNNVWFIGYYFLVIVISFLFLNKLLVNFNKKEYLSFLITLFAIISFSWSRGLLDSLINNLSVLVNGIFLYSLGGYIKKYNPLDNIKNYIFILIIIVIFGFVLISQYNSTYLSIENYMRNNSTSTYYQSIMGYGNYSIVPLTIGVCIFELFRRIRIPKSKIINHLGSCTLTIYIFHDNDFVRNIFRLKDWISELYYTPIVFIIDLLKYTIVTFILGVIVFMLYQLFMKLITSKRFKKFITKKIN